MGNSKNPRRFRVDRERLMDREERVLSPEQKAIRRAQTAILDGSIVADLARSRTKGVLTVRERSYCDSVAAYAEDVVECAKADLEELGCPWPEDDEGEDGA